MNAWQFLHLSPVAINLIVQHIQDILNGDICKWQRTSINGHARGLKRAISEQADLQNGAANPPGKRVLLEPSCRPHWDCACVDGCVQTVNTSLRICCYWFWSCNCDASLTLCSFFFIFKVSTIPWCKHAVLQPLHNLTVIIGALTNTLVNNAFHMQVFHDWLFSVDCGQMTG